MRYLSPPEPWTDGDKCWWLGDTGLGTGEICLHRSMLRWGQMRTGIPLRMAHNMNTASLHGSTAPRETTPFRLRPLTKGKSAANANYNCQMDHRGPAAHGGHKGPLPTAVTKAAAHGGREPSGRVSYFVTIC